MSISNQANKRKTIKPNAKRLGLGLGLAAVARGR